MIGRNPKSRAMAIGVFFVPLILVKGTAMMMAEPRGASGSTGTVARPPDLPDLRAYTPEWSEGQLAVVRRVEELRHLAFGPSPLLHSVEEAQPMDPGERTSAPPVVVVRAILRSASGNLARIGHKVFREGDELGDTGWTVMDIDADTRSVRIVHVATETEAMLFVPLPR